VFGNGNLWNAYPAIKHIRYGPDWKADVIRPQTRFFKDVKAGQLRTVSWITPTCVNSDHAGCGSAAGPAWVASIVNAVGESKFWDSTAIFVFWDEYGGWYDHVPPHKLDYDGLGLRVPLLIVSPYAKKGYVSHVQYEHGSLLRFIEDQFGLGRLAASDARANSPGPDCFDFNQKPRPFVPIQSPHDERYFLTQALDPRPVDTE
jgi:phospholipase C